MSEQPPISDEPDATRPMATAPPAPPPDAPAVARPLPGSIVASGVLLLVGAALAGLLSLFIFFSGFVLSEMPGNFNVDGTGLTEEELRASLAMAGVFVVVFGAIGMLIAVGHLLAGIGVLRRRTWARILGLVLSVLGCLIFALGLVGSLATSSVYVSGSGLTPEEYEQFAAAGRLVGAVICGIGLAIYLFIGVVLARRGAEFT